MRKIILAAVVLAGICAFAVYIKEKKWKKSNLLFWRHIAILLLTVVTGKRLLKKAVKIYLM